MVVLIPVTEKQMEKAEKSAKLCEETQVARSQYYKCIESGDPRKSAWYKRWCELYLVEELAAKRKRMR